MTSDDLRRIFLGPTLFRLDTLIAPRIVPIFYGIGLVGILVWAINQLFYSFSRSFGDGLWGLIEIIVFGLLWLIVLRVVCEAVLVFFRAHQGPMEQVRATRMSATLLEDVREAIHDLAEDEDMPPPPAPPAPPMVPKPPAVRRTARRTPPAPVMPVTPVTPSTIITPPAPSAAPVTPVTPSAPPLVPDDDF